MREQRTFSYLAVSDKMNIHCFRLLVAIIALLIGENTMLHSVEFTLELPANLSKDDVQTLLAIKLYETESLSLGQATTLAGYSKRAWLEILGRHHVPIFNYSPEELREELGLYSKPKVVVDFCGAPCAPRAEVSAAPTTDLHSTLQVCYS